MSTKRKYTHWTPEMDNVLTELYPYTRNIDIAIAMGLSHCSVRVRAAYKKLKKHPSFFKSINNKAHFKKGHNPNHAVPVGTVTIRERDDDKREYKIVKVSKTRWRQLNVVNYEKQHGPVPRSYCLWFKDGDTMNCEPENMELITKKERFNRVSASTTLADRWVALKITGKNRMDLVNDVMKDKGLIEVKRQQIILNRTINDTATNSIKA